VFQSFATLHIAAAIWTGMQVFVLLKYCTFKAQVFTRRFIRKIGPLLMFDIANDVLTYFYCFLLFPVTVVLTVLKYELAVADGYLVMCELMRFMMKLWAFIDAVKVRKDVPAFGNYVYFLFAPTLIYRDEYPR
jgi:sterol O-acyltransferase